MTRFAAFINVADLMMMFRSVADVVQKTDLRGLLTLPRIRGGQRQIITAEASPAFKDYQQHLARADRGDRGPQAARCRRATTSCCPSSPTGGTPRSTCGWSGTASDDEPANKLNKLIDNVHRIWAETAAQTLPPAGRHARIRSRAPGR